MAILQIKNDPSAERDEKLVGAMMPQQFVAYLSLYALSHGVPKSYVIREIFEDWYNTVRNQHSEDELISLVSKQVMCTWQDTQNTTPITMVEFGRDLKRELYQKGLSEIDSALILKRFTDGAQEEK